MSGESLFYKFFQFTAAPFQPISSKLASLSAPLTSVATSTPPTRSAPPNDEYLKQLCSLNTSVTQWISEHVDKNPYVDLTPIFKDYETHLSNIDKKVGTLYLEIAHHYCVQSEVWIGYFMLLFGTVLKKGEPIQAVL